MVQKKSKDKFTKENRLSNNHKKRQQINSVEESDTE